MRRSARRPLGTILETCRIEEAFRRRARSPSKPVRAVAATPLAILLDSKPGPPERSTPTEKPQPPPLPASKPSSCNPGVGHAQASRHERRAPPRQACGAQRVAARATEVLGRRVRSGITPDQRNKATLNLYTVRSEDPRLEGGVGGFQSDGTPAAAQPL